VTCGTILRAVAKVQEMVGDFFNNEKIALGNKQIQWDAVAYNLRGLIVVQRIKKSERRDKPWQRKPKKKKPRR
jgi:hypothetical protein